MAAAEKCLRSVESTLARARLELGTAPEAAATVKVAEEAVTSSTKKYNIAQKARASLNEEYIAYSRHIKAINELVARET